jgi:hypothetical protein
VVLEPGNIDVTWYRPGSNNINPNLQGRDRSGVKPFFDLGVPVAKGKAAGAIVIGSRNILVEFI